MCWQCLDVFSVDKLPQAYVFHKTWKGHDMSWYSWPPPWLDWAGGERDTKCLSRATSHNAWAPPPPHPSNLLWKKNPCKTQKSFKWSFHRPLGYLGLPDEAGERRLRELSRPIEKASKIWGVWHSMARKRSHLYPANGWKMMKAVKRLWINSLVIEPIPCFRTESLSVPPLFDGWDLSNELLNGHYTSGSVRNSEKRQRQEKTWEIIIELFYDVYLSWQLMMYIYHDN